MFAVEPHAEVHPVAVVVAVANVAIAEDGRRES